MVHLHVHSHYSLLDGLSKIPDLVETAKKQGSKALALTDHGVMYGAVEFYKACKKADIKPIIGCEAYITSGKLTDRELRRGERNFYHITLLAKNYTGYVNLMKLTTKAHLEGFYYKPRIDHEVLKEHKEGIICLSGCMASELSRAIIDNDMKKAREIMAWHKDLFGEDYYIELQKHQNIPENARLNTELVKLAKEFDLEIVATADSHYVCAEDAEAHDILVCMQTGALVSDTDRLNMSSEALHLKDPAEMQEEFKDLPEAIKNSEAIAEKCNVEIPMGEHILPKFDVPTGEPLGEYFEKQVQEGIKYRYGEDLSQKVIDRVKMESDIITKEGFQGYMLIVADFVVWAKNQKIMVGPGRGSAAGSIIAYALKITDIDPIEHNLLFERFLNPDRISMPDIDIDIADNRRSEVLDYVVEKYGREQVAQIITFGTMASRMAIRDVGRVLGAPYADIDKIAKLIPPPQQGFHVTLKEHLKNVPELKESYEKDEIAKKVIDLAARLEGTVRHASTHAAGVVIGDKDLTNYTPLQRGSTGDESIVTQYSMDPVEDLGLLKMDFLGLKNLTIIQNTLRIVRKIYDEDIQVDKILLDDVKTFELLSHANTTGVFQLESDGMRRYLKELKPTAFNDIVSIVALYRPGPIEFIQDFIDRKHGKKEITYLHPKLEPILKNTYGIAVVQEQVMQIAKELCGFTAGEADVLRKAMGKKIPELMEEQKEKFVQGAVKNDMSGEMAKKLWSFVEPFAAYGFNRAHSACYALIAYWTAYLKVHYPSAFLAALMTSDQGNLDRISIDMAEAERFNLKVLPPSINESFIDFAVVPETGNIRFGLNVIKNVGRKVSEQIEEERQKNGKYKDLTNFLTRVPKEALNKKTLESLSRSGALDDFGDRREIFDNIEKIINFVNGFHRYNNSSQVGMFEGDDNHKPVFELQAGVKATEQELLAWEKELLGTFVSKHPLKDIMPRLKGRVRPISSLNSSFDNKNITVGGIITKIKEVTTRNNQNMAFARIEDLGGSMEMIVFPKIMSGNAEILKTDKIVVVEGKVNVKDRVNETDGEMTVESEAKVIAEKITEVTEDYLKKPISNVNVEQNEFVQNRTIKHYSYTPNGLLIRVPRGFNGGQLKELKELLEKHQGGDVVELEIFSEGKWQRLKTKTTTLINKDLEKELDLVLS
ncbi:MAG: DNA polymerase III subunit alpha [Patescibacteria group bacterium]|nr:DNA polymerase III subunit alpha [Patescibacteria group bacterium]